MSDFCLVTDSTADLPVEITNEFNIKIVPLKYEIDNTIYEDCFGEDREKNLDKFYELIKAKKRVKTSQINPSELVSAFEPILSQGTDIFYITFTSGLSGTYDSAKIAAKELAEKFPDRKYIAVDSLCASMGEGFLVYEAVKKKREGFGIEKLADWVEKNKLRMCHWVIVDDLNHLKAGGRISAASAFFGSILNVKPLIHVNNKGQLVLMGKHRGKRQSIEFLLQKMKTTADKPIETVFICYSGCIDDANWTAEKLKSDFGVKNVLISKIGCVIGAHTGLGVIAIFFWGSVR
jgi:DegV family protein with EDD domain